MTPLIRKCVGLAPEPESAMWFDVGDIKSKFSQQEVSFEFLIRLPFARTAAVGIDANGNIFCLMLLAGDNNVTVSGFHIDENSFSKYWHPIAYVLTDEGLKYYTKHAELSQTEAAPVIRMVFACLTVIHAQSTSYRATHAQTKVNQKRIKKGKNPLFDWVTVKVGGKEEKIEHKGGTHASPRLHDRRGHWRTIKATGKQVWVRNCKVGDASKGVVFHDYKIKNAE